MFALLAVGTQARLMSQALRKLTANASKCNCTILFLNQLRHKVGVVYGNPEITSGGQALKFYASVRLEVRRKQTVEDSAGNGIGIKVKAKASCPTVPHFFNQGTKSQMVRVFGFLWSICLLL